jgi:hypothetical protein
MKQKIILHPAGIEPLAITVSHDKREKKQKECFAPCGNRIHGKCLEGIYVTTTPRVHTSYVQLLLKVGLSSKYKKAC